MSPSLHPEPHPFAGKTITIKSTTETDHNGQKFDEQTYVLDAMRTGFNGPHTLDNEVVYGKTPDGRGHLIHESEIGEMINQ